MATVSPSTEKIVVEVHADTRPAVRALRRLNWRIFYWRYAGVIAGGFVGGLVGAIIAKAVGL